MARERSQTYRGDNDSFFVQDNEPENDPAQVEHSPTGGNHFEVIEISDTEEDSHGDKGGQPPASTETRTKKRTAPDTPKRQHMDGFSGGKRLKRLTGYSTETGGSETHVRNLGKVPAPSSPKPVRGSRAVINQSLASPPRTINAILNSRINNYRLLINHTQSFLNRNNVDEPTRCTERKLRAELEPELQQFGELVKSVQMSSTTSDGSQNDLNQLIGRERHRSHCQALVRAVEIWEAERDRNLLRRKKAMAEALKKKVCEMLEGS